MLPYLTTALLCASLIVTSTSAACPAIDNKNVPKNTICGTSGVLITSKTLGGTYSPSKKDYTSCRDICMQNLDCKSFSYTQSSNQCRFYKVDTNQRFFIKLRSANSIPRFWSASCYTIPTTCASASSTSVPPIPTETASLSSTTTTSTSARRTAGTTTTTTTTTPTTTSVIETTTTTPPPATTINTSTEEIGDDFTATYTYEEMTLPTFTTGPVAEQGLATTILEPIASPSPVCFVNPDSVGDMFSVLTPDMSPIIPKTGRLRVIQGADLPQAFADKGYTPPSYYFKKSSAGSGYDLLVTDTAGKLLYVGFDTLNSNVVTATTSSATGRIITSIFSISCQGQLLINYDGAAYIWGVGTNGIDTIMTKGSQSVANTMLVLPKAAADAAGQATVKPRRKRQINYTGGAAPRCPNTPPGLRAIAAQGARSPSANGCGSGATSSVLPQFTFTECCNAHDYCFDNCEGGYFEDCNNVFRTCMDKSCDSISAFWHPIDRLKCETAAQLYYYVVASWPGRSAFYSANYYDAAKAAKEGSGDTGRCVCACPFGQSYCNGQCLNYANDNNNCGGCGTKCLGTNTCKNGQCVCPFDTQNDVNNCGACGNQCPKGLACSGGQCKCPKNQCGNLCLDFQTHPRNCGSCGNICDSGYCSQGQCMTPPSGSCFPGDVIKNGGFDSGLSPWQIVPGDTSSGVGFDGGSDSAPNSCLLMNQGPPMMITQNIALCPGTRYQLTFQIRSIDVKTSICSWEAWAAGQRLGSGLLDNILGSRWVANPPSVFMDALPPGVGKGKPGSANYQSYQYNFSGQKAYSQLAIITQCKTTDFAAVRIDSVSMFPV